MISRVMIAGATLVVSLAVGAAFAFALSYLLGHSILDGAIAGSDSPLHVGYAIWINRYFPDLPHWYPLQGAGISLLHGYSILPHILVVVIHRLTDLSILQAFRLISFLSFPLTAVGIYVFCWSELRSRTAGIIAIALFLLAPVTWTWLYNWGFFPQQVATMLLPVSLLIFNRAMKAEITPSKPASRRVWAGSYILALSIAALSHMMVAAAIGLGSLLIGIFTGLSAGNGERRRILIRCLKFLGLCSGVVSLLLAAYLVPFYLYGQEANRGGYSTPAPSEVHKLPIPEFFGLRPIDPREILTRMQFPLGTIAFAAAGVILAFVLSRKGNSEARQARALGLSAIVGTVFTLTPALSASVLRVSGLLYYFINFRSVLILVTFLLPVLAGFGAHSFFLVLLGSYRQTQHHRDGTKANQRLTTLGGIVSGVLSLSLVAAAIMPAAKPASAHDVDLPFGPVGLDADNLWNVGVQSESISVADQLNPWNWPELTLQEGDGSINESKRLASELPSDQHSRIDISPYVGERAKDLVAYADASQINTYTFQINLFKDMWSYEQSVLFSQEAPVNEYGNARTLQGIADWFGIEYVILDAEQDPTEHYQAAGWFPMLNEGSMQIWQNPAPAPLVSVTTKPSVLVVGKRKTDAYMTIFRLANDGMLPYSQALLVEGKERVDDYELAELKEFSAVILYGYDYRDGTKAWEMLRSYVEGGGSIFVDTGWEFWIPEWEFENAPEILPVGRTTWTDYGMPDEYDLGPPEIVGDLDATLFKPLAWEGLPWTLSGVDPRDVRNWGQVALSTGGKPLLVAGEYGKGRVVWSGMNLVAHAVYLGWNYEEIKLLNHLLGWLLQGKESKVLSADVLPRDDPDRVEIAAETLPGSVNWLYWREAYYPDWRAFVADSTGTRELPVYRAGPGLMAVPVRTEDERAVISLQWQLSIAERFSIAVSIFGGILLAAMLLDGLLLSGSGLTWVKIGALTLAPRPFLGDGPNREWAERKRHELETGRRRTGQSVHNPAEASPWFEEGESSDDSGQKPNERRRYLRETGRPRADRISDEQQAKLLEAWLASTAHQDDAWARKLLAKGSSRPQQSGNSEIES